MKPSKNAARSAKSSAPAKGKPAPVVSENVAASNISGSPSSSVAVDSSEIPAAPASVPEPAPAPVNPVAVGAKKMSLTTVPDSMTLTVEGHDPIVLTKSAKPRKSKSVIYTSTDLRGTVRFPASAFTGAAAAKPKLSKEERAAQRAAMTPADKLQREKDRLAKQQARIAKLEAAAAAAPTA
jgi:hypothetical protein